MLCKNTMFYAIPNDARGETTLKPTKNKRLQAKQ